VPVFACLYGGEISGKLINDQSTPPLPRPACRRWKARFLLAQRA